MGLKGIESHAVKNPQRNPYGKVSHFLIKQGSWKTTNKKMGAVLVF